MLMKDQDLFQQERAAVVKAGLESSRGPHRDGKGARVSGVKQHCHVLCNALYSFYYTTAGLDRRSYLRVLLGGADLTFRLNERAVVLLEQLKVGQKWRAKVAQVVPQEQDLDEEQLDALLDRHLPTLGPLVRKDIKDCLAIAAYQPQRRYPIVSPLLRHDAPQFNWLTLELALCWIHEFRHYKALIPRFTHHLTLLQHFANAFCDLYHTLFHYPHHPASPNS